MHSKLPYKAMKWFFYGQLSCRYAFPVSANLDKYFDACSRSLGDSNGYELQSHVATFFHFLSSMIFSQHLNVLFCDAKFIIHMMLQLPDASSLPCFPFPSVERWKTTRQWNFLFFISSCCDAMPCNAALWVHKTSCPKVDPVPGEKYFSPLHSFFRYGEEIV